ncbi:semaphorin-7A isoform X3 [Apteryx mantelli]|uniref:Semaphorin-7A isoform X3 n=1 Tax=Apteryx mantelli TaxID=2696672 RepID=A0ABM4F9E9_9AVES
MGRRSPVALFVALWASQLGLWAAGRSKVNPRIITAPQGAREYVFPTSEKYPVFYHKENSSAIFVGGEGKLYYYDFATYETYTEDFPVIKGGQCMNSGGPEDNKNYLTLLGEDGNGMLVCGTGACSPTCWHWEQKKKGSPSDGRGIAPFSPDSNSLVVVDGHDIYSTIKKSQQNGKIPRFRRVRGGGELYTSDTVMQNPQFVKATTLRHEEPHQDKIYYFFREDNPDKSPEAPRNISRVAQLCKEDKGGTSSLSASKWTTFLKASLICVDPVTKGNFNWLQDVFFVPSSNWRDSKVYGLFTNTWGSSAVCVYSFGDIDNVFRTSKLKGYNGPNPDVKPGQCVSSGQHTPSETFKIADSHPEVEDRVEPIGPTKSPLFHNKHRYQKIGVHEVSAADGRRYNVLYLATDNYQNITVVPFSRYYLNCPVESHYATYNWYHNDFLIKTCNNTHPQQDCFHFIQNVSLAHFGRYVCISEEDGFRQALVKERLVDQLRFMSQMSQATMTFGSWLHLLLMVVLVELFH